MMMLQLIGRTNEDGCVVECWVGPMGSLECKEFVGSFYVPLATWKEMLKNRVIIQFQEDREDPGEQSPSITSFRGDYRFLSNFYPAEVRMSGMEYPTVEHAFQAAKTKDPNLRWKVRAAGTPGEAKRMGKNLELRPDWEEIKLEVMLALVRYKFTHHPELAEKLLTTGNVTLVEGNDWGDTFWGACRKGFHGQAQLEGQNHLGLILMKVRDELRHNSGK